MLVVSVLVPLVLLACGGVGVLLSTVVDRADVARRIAIALVFVLFLIDSISASAAGLEWIGRISPTYYYDPMAILVDGTYELAVAAVLLAGTLVLVAASGIRFRRDDIGA